jgi:hypothetical protein
MSAESNVVSMESTKLPEDKARTHQTIAAAVMVIGIIISVVGAIIDSNRFAFSYLVGFSYAFTLVMGAIFFLLVTHATKAGWSVVARRHMEFVAGAAPALIALFIPVALFAPKIYFEWWHPAEGDEILAHKAPYLNPTFFFVRSAIYLIAWSVIGLWYARTSRAQDTSSDPSREVNRMQVAAAPLIIVFALTLSFAAFDWIMSLQPHWYSTIFGVYIFGGSFLTALSFLAIMTVTMHKAGLFRRISTVEHRQDIGKLMFAFTVFWGYIAFSQYMLQWYANLPEETFWFRNRWTGGWRTVSLALIFIQFAFPFLWLLPKTTKRHFAALTLGAAALLIGHYIDLYWLIMPAYDLSLVHHLPGPHDTHGVMPHWIDLGGLLAPVGVILFLTVRAAARGPIYPVRDPYLAETVKVENL